MPPMTKSHHGHLHVMLVTVCGYEQNPSRVVEGVPQTRFWVVHTDGQMDGWTDGRMDIRRSTSLWGA